MNVASTRVEGMEYRPITEKQSFSVRLRERGSRSKRPSVWVVALSPQHLVRVERCREHVTIHEFETTPSDPKLRAIGTHIVQFGDQWPAQIDRSSLKPWVAVFA